MKNTAVIRRYVIFAAHALILIGLILLAYSVFFVSDLRNISFSGNILPHLPITAFCGFIGAAALENRQTR